MEIKRYGNKDLTVALAAFATVRDDAVREAGDMDGNAQYWFHLDGPAKLVPAALALKSGGARLAMVSACRKDMAESTQDIAYHFEVAGIMYTLLVTLTDAEPSTPSITFIFNNADWHEREMIELFGIKVSDQPNPHRLFLDEEMDAGLLQGAVPLSVLMNGACSKDLWERVLSGRTAENKESIQ